MYCDQKFSLSCSSLEYEVVFELQELVFSQVVLVLYMAFVVVVVEVVDDFVVVKGDFQTVVEVDYLGRKAWLVQLYFFLQKIYQMTSMPFQTPYTLGHHR